MIDYVTGEIKDVWEYKDKTQIALIFRSMCDNYDDFHGAGGNLHIFLDDGNYDSLESCRKACADRGDHLGMIICGLGRNFSPEELEMILDRGWEFFEHFENEK
jgi:hypothetical protein